MSLIKNQFFEKKIYQLFDNHSIVLLFHYNNITSKEWLELKKKLFQANPFIQNKIIPNRFLSQLLKNMLIESTTGEQLQLQASNAGSSCLFFCSSLDNLNQIFLILGSTLKGGTGTSGSENSQKQFEYFISSNQQKLNTLKFLNKGMLNKKKVEFKQDLSTAQQYLTQQSPNTNTLQRVFFSPYDIKKMLELGLESDVIYFQLFQVFSRNANFITDLQNFVAWTGGHPRTLFNIQHYNLINILNIWRIRAEASNIIK